MSDEADDAREPAPGRSGPRGPDGPPSWICAPGTVGGACTAGCAESAGGTESPCRLDRGTLHGGEAAPGEARDQPRAPDRQRDHRDGDEGAAQTSGAGTTACQHGCSVEDRESPDAERRATSADSAASSSVTCASSACRSGQGRNALAKPLRISRSISARVKPSSRVRQPVLVGQRHAGHEPAVGAERDHQPGVEVGAHRMVRRPGHRPGLHVAGDVGLDGHPAVANIVAQHRILVQPGAVADAVGVAAVHRLGDRLRRPPPRPRGR